MDGSQDCLFAPISTTTDPPKGRLLGVRRPLLFPVANELAAITATLQEEAGTHDGTSLGQKGDKDWIPACAGMTDQEMDSRLRGNDGLIRSRRLMW